MGSKLVRVPQWEPTEEQRKFLLEMAKTHGTVTGYIRSLVSEAMSKEGKK